MLELRSDMICAIFRKATRQDLPLFSVPPSIQVNDPRLEPQVKNWRRSPGHDDGPVQPQRIRGAQFVTPVQRREREANALFAENGCHRVIVVAIRIAEDRQAGADFSLQIFLRTLNLFAHLSGRNFRHDGMGSRMRPERQTFPGKLAELVPAEDAASLYAARPEFGAN